MVDMNELTEDDSLSLVPDVEVTDPPTKAEVMYIDFEEGPLILVPVHAAPNFAPYVYDSVDSRFFQWHVGHSAIRKFSCKIIPYIYLIFSQFFFFEILKILNGLHLLILLIWLDEITKKHVPCSQSL